MSEDAAVEETTRIRQLQCRERLLKDEFDLDAVFTKAAWLAKAKEYEKAMECLDTISKRDPFYPGVWLLKSKVYSLMGNEKMARLCKERGDEQSR